MIRSIKTKGLDPHTLVVVASDHGRRAAGSLYGDGGARLHMVARWPGVVPPATRTQFLVANIDWAPTVWDFAGVDCDYWVPGKRGRKYPVGGAASSPSGPLGRRR